MMKNIAPVCLALLLTYASPCLANNTVGGTAAGAGLTTGTDNTILGVQAGGDITTGTDNTLVGYESGHGVTGNYNIILGEDPSSAITSGSSNILIGNSLMEVTDSSSSQIDIGDTLYGTLGGSGTITAANNFTVLGTIIGNLFSGSGASLTSLNGSNISSGTVGATYGGLGANESAATGVVQFSSGTSSVSTALANGTTATTQSESDTSTKVATDAFVADITTLSDLTSASALATVGTITTGVWNAGAVTSSGTIKGTTFNTSAASGAYEINSNNVLSLPDSDTTSIAVGESALASQNSTSLNNTAVGDDALNAITTGDDSVAVGFKALYATTGSANTALGFKALTAITTGTNSTAIGYDVLTAASGSPNTALGYESGDAITTGTDNTLVGYEAGLDVTGSHNIVLGEDPSGAITSGSSNILIGNSLTEVTGTTSSQLDLGDTIYGTLGGSGLITFANNIALANSTAHRVLVAEGASAIVGVSPSTSGYVLTSNGTGSDPSFQAAAAPPNNAIASAASGFVNKFRNGNMLVSQRMVANTSTSLTTTDAYWIDGWEYHVTGAAVTGYWQNTAFTATSGSNPAYLPGYMEIKGAASNTAIDIYQKIESFDASALAGQVVTVQFQFYNDSGATITPTVQSCYASTQDNFATCTSDLSASNMQACSNGSTCTEAYSFTPSTSATNGYEVKFAFGAMTSSSDIIEMSGFDIRATPGVSTGTNSSPPVIEQPTFAAELVRDQRYFETSYGNGVALGTSTATGVHVSGGQPTTHVFAVPKRVAPSLSYWDTSGNASKYSTFSGTTFTANVGAVNTALQAAIGSFWTLIGVNVNNYAIHWSASAEL